MTKEELAQYNKEYRQKNKERLQKRQKTYNLANKERITEYQKQARDDRMSQIYENESCFVCGVADPRCLTFHHKVKGKKNGNLSKMTTKNALEEKKLCVCLCFNHHNIFHCVYGSSNFPSWNEIKEKFKEDCLSAEVATIRGHAVITTSKKEQDNV